MITIKKKLKVVNSVKNRNNNKKKRKVGDSVKNNHNRTLIIGFSNCGKSYLRNHNLYQKQEPVFTNTKSQNKYPNVKAQTSGETQPLETYENSTVVVDMLLSKQENNFDLFFPRWRDNEMLIYTTYLKVIFISQKRLFVTILI